MDANTARTMLRTSVSGKKQLLGPQLSYKAPLQVIWDAFLVLTDIVEPMDTI